MPNLIESFGQFRQTVPELAKLTTIDCAIEQLGSALRFLRECAWSTVAEVAKVPLTFGWGSAVKRKRVLLGNGERPLLLKSAQPDHNLMEVINLCATVERLMDALAWAKQNE